MARRSSLEIEPLTYYRDQLTSMSPFPDQSKSSNFKYEPMLYILYIHTHIRALYSSSTQKNEEKINEVVLVVVQFSSDRERYYGRKHYNKRGVGGEDIHSTCYGFISSDMWLLYTSNVVGMRHSLEGVHLGLGGHCRRVVFIRG